MCKIILMALLRVLDKQAARYALSQTAHLIKKGHPHGVPFVGGEGGITSLRFVAFAQCKFC